VLRRPHPGISSDLFTQKLKKEQAMKRNYKLLVVSLWAVTGLSIAMAQNAPPTPQQRAETAAATRQGLFRVQAFAFGPVGAMLKDAPFDASTVLKEAPRIEMTSSMIPEVFLLDTRTFDVKTKARREIWTKIADFEQKAKDLNTAATELETAAKTGDRAVTLKAIEKVGQACKSCHDDYKDK
jgi:cytochrome c556